MLDNGLMVTAVPTGPDLISLAGHSGPAPAALLDPSGMKREGYARSSAKRSADCEFRALMISAHLDPAISPACARPIPATIRNSTLLFPATLKNAPCSLRSRSYF
jgi:hypothetical protein